MKTSDEVRSFTVDADDDGIRVDRWFKRHLPQVGFGTVSKWARTGQVRVDGKRVKPDDRLAEGQQIRVPPGGDAPHKQPKTKRELKPAEIEQAEAMLIEQTKSGWSTGSTRIPAAYCWWRARRAARPISRSAFRAVRRKRSTGRW